LKPRATVRVRALGVRRPVAKLGIEPLPAYVSACRTLINIQAYLSSGMLPCQVLHAANLGIKVPQMVLVLTYIHNMDMLWMSFPFTTEPNL
jgi:hypothetical protein